MTDQTNPKDIIGSKKTPLSLIPPAGLEEIAKAMKNGADKYSAYNWRDKKVQYLIYIDAIMRHAQALIEREDIAEDSGVHHLGHIGANACILLDAIKYDRLVDNRPNNPNSSLLEPFVVKANAEPQGGGGYNGKFDIQAYPTTEKTVNVEHVKDAYACQTKQCRCGKITISTPKGC